MRLTILVLSWLSIAGGILGALLYSSKFGFLAGFIYLVVGLLAAIPLFGLATALRSIEEQQEQIESLRGELSQMRRAKREEAPIVSHEEIRKMAPMVSGPRKIQEAPEAPKIDLSGIKESGNS